MKIQLYILSGNSLCEIYKNKRLSRFDEIKDEIIRFDFNTKIEMNSFIKNYQEESEEEFIILSEAEVIYIMENAPSNKDFLIRNIKTISKN